MKVAFATRLYLFIPFKAPENESYILSHKRERIKYGSMSRSIDLVV